MDETDEMEAARLAGEAAAARHADIRDMSFEVAMAELQGIVEKLERGKLPLEESISSYERGTLLRQHCERVLRQAELRVEVIARDDGTTRPPSFKLPD